MSNPTIEKLMYVFTFCVVMFVMMKAMQQYDMIPEVGKSSTTAKIGWACALLANASTCLSHCSTVAVVPTLNVFHQRLKNILECKHVRIISYE
jgi:hypothetical protein